MKRCRSLVVLALTVITTGVPTMGRGGDKADTPAVPAPVVAVVDLGYLFENYAPVRARMAEITAEAQRRQEEVKEEQAELLALAKKIDETPKGSPEYRAMVERLERTIGETRGNPTAQQARDEGRPTCQQRQAAVYHETYELFRQEIADYAKANQIAVVIRHNRTPIDEKNPQDVLRGVNAQVVWIAPGRDITPVILQRVNGKAGPGR